MSNEVIPNIFRAIIIVQKIEVNKDAIHCVFTIKTWWNQICFKHPSNARFENNNVMV